MTYRQSIYRLEFYYYVCNLTDRQAFFIMEASTDQKNFHVIMEKTLTQLSLPCIINVWISSIKDCTVIIFVIMTANSS